MGSVPPDAAQSTNYHPAPPAQTEDSSDRQLYFDPLGHQLARTKQTARKQRELVYDPLGRQVARTKQTPLGRQLARTKQTSLGRQLSPVGRQLARTKQTARKQRELVY